MKIEPVKRYNEPKYAAYEYLLDHPELLNKVPERWRGNTLVMTAVCAIAMMVNTSRSSDSTHTLPPITVEANAPQIAHDAGGMGIMLHIITELEAQKIIQDEAAKSGIIFKSDSIALPKIKIPLHFQRGGKLPDSVRYTKELKLILDGHETKHKIAYEFVSQEDVNIWKREDTTAIPCNLNIDMKNTANELQNELRHQKNNLHIGVFYDQSGSEVELRKQVDEFIKWLKAEGVI